MNQQQEGIAAKTTAGETKSFENTVVAATLDAPIEPGKNVVWCASFQAAWKRLQHDLVKEPVRLDGAEELVEALNNAPDPAEDIPEEWLYAAAGLTEDGIVERIVRELAERFPDKEAPDFPGAVGLVAYAYLTATLKFPEPYLQNDEPLLFTGSNGRQTPISSFGLREKDSDAYRKLRFQPRLFHVAGDGPHFREFAVDLCWPSTDIQLVVAALEPADTLRHTVDIVLSWSEATRSEWTPGLGDKTVLLVPDMDWSLEHNYSDLLEKVVLNPACHGYFISKATQDVKFQLDRSGAQLFSEAQIMLTLGGPPAGPAYFILDWPFLLYMKLRESERPFLAMWIDNAELLKPFSAEEALAAQPSAEDTLAALPTAEDAWLRAQEIFERVESIVGPEASPDPQATEAFRIYKEWCGQARRDHENGRLYQDVIDDLQWSADRLIKIHRGEWPKPQPPAEPPTPEPTPAPVIDEKAQPAGGILGRLFDRLRGK